MVKMMLGSVLRMLMLGSVLRMVKRLQRWIHSRLVVREGLGPVDGMVEGFGELERAGQVKEQKQEISLHGLV